MNRTLSIAVITIAIVLVAGLVAQARSTRGVSGSTLDVIEHATTDKGVDIGAHGDSTGDLITWHNQLFNSADVSKVGRDQGECFRINVAAGSWECSWTNWVPGGSITIEGPFFDTKDSTLAITGGTGNYAGAGGSMLLHSMNGGTEYDFLFTFS